MMFRDRVHAGRELACELAGRVTADAVVFGVSRGGHVVAEAVARSSGAALERLDPDDPSVLDGVGVAGRTVVLVDDAVTTGVAVTAACDAARESGASRILVAAPVGAVDAIGRARSVADEVVVLDVVADPTTVPARYEDRYEGPGAGGSRDGTGGDGTGPGLGPHGQGPGVLLRAG